MLPFRQWYVASSAVVSNMFKTSTINLAQVYAVLLKLILLLAIVTNTLMLLTFTFYLNGYSMQMTNEEMGQTYSKNYSQFQYLPHHSKIPQNLKSIQHIDLNVLQVNETTKTKIILFVNNEANTIGKKGVTYPKSYFVNSKFPIDFDSPNWFLMSHASGCKLPCLVTNDKDYLGEDNIDQFDALIFKIRFFKTDEKGT